MKITKSNIIKNQVFYKIIVVNILVTIGTIKIMQAHERVIIRSIPEIVYIKESSSAQYINVKFYLENKTRYILKIKRFSLKAYNAENKIILNKQIDLKETRPGIGGTAEQKLLKGAPVYYNNPFTRFSLDLELHKLEFQFTFTNNQTAFSINEKIEIYPEYLDFTSKNNMNTYLKQNFISKNNKNLNKGIQLFSCLLSTNSK